jgi:hypothetical protein
VLKFVVVVVAAVVAVVEGTDNIAVDDTYLDS